MSKLNFYQAIANKLTANKELLNNLDQAIGDGDHGTNIVRGFTEVVALGDKLEVDWKGSLNSAAMVLISKIGGSSGPLLGTAFMKMAPVVGEGKSVDDWAKAFTAAIEGIKMRGKAEVGEATMLDALVPATGAFAKESNLKSAFAAASVAADNGAKSTIDIIATKGRASYLGERSKGHEDPGARSTQLIFSAISEVLHG